MIKHLDITISGRVQMVGFRYHAKQRAVDLGVKGKVQNQPDGTVLIEAEAEDQQLEQFLAWCRHGPDQAQVSRIEYSESQPRNYDTFEIV